MAYLEQSSSIELIMSCVKENVEHNYLKDLEKSKKELEKYVYEHARKMASIPSNIDKEESILQDCIDEFEKRRRPSTNKLQPPELIDDM